MVGPTRVVSTSIRTVAAPPSALRAGDRGRVGRRVSLGAGDRVDQCRREGEDDGRDREFGSHGQAEPAQLSACRRATHLGPTLTAGAAPGAVVACDPTPTAIGAPTGTLVAVSCATHRRPWSPSTRSSADPATFPSTRTP